MKRLIVSIAIVVALCGALLFISHKSGAKAEKASAPQSKIQTAQNKPLPAPSTAKPEVKRAPPVFGDARIQSAWSRFSLEKDQMKQEDQLRAFIEGIEFGDIASVLDRLAAQAQKDEFAEGTAIRLLRRWAEIDPGAAARWAERLQESPFRKDAYSAVAIMWSNVDLAQAAEWAAELSRPDEKSAAVKSVAYEAARTDPVTALDLAEELEPGIEREDLVRHASLQWAATDPEAAAEWGARINDPALRARALSDIATAWAEKDPTAAARLAVLSIAPGRAQDDAVVGIVQRWVQKDPKKTVSWVELFPEGGLKNIAVENAVRIWAEQDSESAAAWLEGIKDSTFYDSAAGEFTTWLKVWSPEAALKWEETLSAEYKRRNKVEEMESSIQNDSSFKPWIMGP